MGGVYRKQKGVLQIGDGQVWWDVSSARFVSVVYTNSTGRSIQVSISLLALTTTSKSGYFVVDGVNVAFCRQDGGAVAHGTETVSVIVPDGSTYMITGLLNGVGVWSELR